LSTPSASRRPSTSPPRTRSKPVSKRGFTFLLAFFLLKYRFILLFILYF
jgi:hypothetical protein